MNKKDQNIAFTISRKSEEHPYIKEVNITNDVIKLTTKENYDHANIGHEITNILYEKEYVGSSKIETKNKSIIQGENGEQLYNVITITPCTTEVTITNKSIEKYTHFIKEYFQNI